MIFDTHTHYYDGRFDHDREELLAGLPGAGVGLVVNVSADMESSLASVEMAEKYPFIYAAVGIHPSGAGAEDYLSKLREYAGHPKVVAIGEIGLDYHYDEPPRDVQLRCFRQQLELACELQKPVIIHDREAHEDSLRIIREYRDLPRGVFHCYSGSVEMAKLLVGMGFYISFTGNVTFTNAKKLWEVASWVPDDRLMIETDCPYMAPVPMRGQRNDSRLLTYLTAKLAELRSTTPGEIEALTFENGRKFFNIP